MRFPVDCDTGKGFIIIYYIYIHSTEMYNESFRQMTDS